MSNSNRMCGTQLNPVNAEIMKNISTLDLINELKERSGVEKGASGLWKEFDLTRRYSNHDRHIEAALVLVVRDLSSIE